jgi:peptidoglycan hydrolase-like protein with peptidoglycan-binding domain
MRKPRRTTTTTIAVAPALALLALAFPNAEAVASSGGASAPGAAGAASGNTGGAQTSGITSSGSGSKAHRSTGSATPMITGVDCYRVGSTSCTRNPRSVEMGGELVVHGQHLTSTLTVVFPSTGARAARVEKIVAPLRPTAHGFAVTVPDGVKSGRIMLRTRSGVESRLYGPVTILPAPSTPVSDGLPNSAFDDPGIWIWYLNQTDGGNLANIAAKAKAAGIKTLFIKSSDGASNFWSQFSPAMVQTFHADGLNVCAWQYVYGADPAGEAAMGARAVADGADCLVIDAESEYQGNYAGAQTYIEDLRASIGPNYPVGLASFPYVDYHESEPYSVFLGPGGAQYDVPQVYWSAIGTSPASAYSHTYVENRIYGRPIVPIGQTYGNATPTQITQFRQLALAYGAPGLSWYSWQSTPNANWLALDAPLAPATGITVPTAWPSLSKGSRGDQVVWMQEHLASAEPQTPISGILDATTEAALKAFQASQGIPQSGVTDAATWTALLALQPVAVQWNATGTSTGSTGSTGSTSSTGSSGSSGASGSSGNGGTAA